MCVGLLLAKESHPIFTSDLKAYILAMRKHFTSYEKLWSGELFKVLKHVNDCPNQIFLFHDDDIYFDNVEILRTEVKRATAGLARSYISLGLCMVFLGVSVISSVHIKRKNVDLYCKHMHCVPDPGS